ncbi:DUF222 domain-containing protein [Nocardioides sp.]|uniref:HNH endonuclease signature motif containing protein n=1 Tax=Nocardioides sp. TaxID=35761 RepID=UPI003782D9CF
MSDLVTHPVLAAASTIDRALTSVADVNPTFMCSDDKAAALLELVRIESRLAALRMRILADADDLAEQTASRDAGEWLATHARTRHEDARAELALARALDRRRPATARALRDGAVTLAQAQVIARALDQLPDEVGTDVLAHAEECLIGHAAQFGPRPLARLAGRILDVVAPEIAEAAEAKRLTALEDEARHATRVTARRIGRGRTRMTIVVPDAMADRALTYLEAFTNPRKAQDRCGHGLAADAVTRLGAYPRRLGAAFCQLLEAVDPSRLPVHGGDATTVLVTLSLDDLRAELATAELIGGSHVPGDDEPTRITAAEARRLACTAGIIPVVLGGDSEILDLGRLQRLFTAAQRKALILRDRRCRAEGCQVAGTWCEAHHWHPWSTGGRTDLVDGVLLCHHHHQRVHDARFTAERLPDGDVRFHRRT